MYDRHRPVATLHRASIPSMIWAEVTIRQFGCRVSSGICSLSSLILLLLICVFLHLGSTKRPAAPLSIMSKGYWKLRRASSPLRVTIYLSHSLGLQIGQTYLQLLFHTNLSFLPSTHSFPPWDVAVTTVLPIFIPIGGLDYLNLRNPR